jgi:DNA-directed RNA polymerase subunit delta
MNMIEAAYEIVKGAETPLTFQQLWKKVVESLNMDASLAENKISKFYTQLSFDNRFVMLEENHWDLRERHSFDEAHIDMNEIYLEEVEDADLIEAGIGSDDVDADEAPKKKKSDDDFEEDFEEAAPEDSFGYGSDDEDEDY